MVVLCGRCQRRATLAVEVEVEMAVEVASTAGNRLLRERTGVEDCLRSTGKSGFSGITTTATCAGGSLFGKRRQSRRRWGCLSAPGLRRRVGGGPGCDCDSGSGGGGGVVVVGGSGSSGRVGIQRRRRRWRWRQGGGYGGTGGGPGGVVVLNGDVRSKDVHRFRKLHAELFSYIGRDFYLVFSFFRAAWVWVPGNRGAQRCVCVCGCEESSTRERKRDKRERAGAGAGVEEERA